MIGKIWRTLREQEATATILVPLWDSATWWLLVAPDAVHLSDAVLDWVWLPREDPTLFVPGVAPGGRTVAPPDWPVLALRVDFSKQRSQRPLSSRQRCLRGGCSMCGSCSLRG